MESDFSIIYGYVVNDNSKKKVNSIDYQVDLFYWCKYIYVRFKNRASPQYLSVENQYIDYNML